MLSNNLFLTILLLVSICRLSYSRPASATNEIIKTLKEIDTALMSDDDDDDDRDADLDDDAKDTDAVSVKDSNTTLSVDNKNSTKTLVSLDSKNNSTSSNETKNASNTDDDNDDDAPIETSTNSTINSTKTQEKAQEKAVTRERGSLVVKPEDIPESEVLTSEQKKPSAPPPQAPPVTDTDLTKTKQQQTVSATGEAAKTTEGLKTSSLKAPEKQPAVTAVKAQKELHTKSAILPQAEEDESSGAAEDESEASGEEEASENEEDNASGAESEDAEETEKSDESDESDEPETAAQTKVEGSEAVEKKAESKDSDDKVKMFFISPFEKENTEEDENNDEPTARQILTYPATGHGHTVNQNSGPSHIWNSDYPYFAYGYSWGCGHHGYGPGAHGTTKKSNTNSKTSKKNDLICRDYVLLPALARAPAVVLRPGIDTDANEQTGVARQLVNNKDIACAENDQACAQRQVIGSMAGGSLFGDGMGGLGMGFPGIPGIHTGVSGYNMAGGFGDHVEGGHAGGGHHGSHVDQGFGGQDAFTQPGGNGFGAPVAHMGGHSHGSLGGLHNQHGAMGFGGFGGQGGHGGMGGHGGLGGHGGMVGHGSMGGMGGMGGAHFFHANHHGDAAYWSDEEAISSSKERHEKAQKKGTVKSHAKKRHFLDTLGSYFHNNNAFSNGINNNNNGIFPNVNPSDDTNFPMMMGYPNRPTHNAEEEQLNGLQGVALGGPGWNTPHRVGFAQNTANWAGNQQDADIMESGCSGPDPSNCKVPANLGPLTDKTIVQNDEGGFIGLPAGRPGLAQNMAEGLPQGLGGINGLNNLNNGNGMNVLGENGMAGDNRLSLLGQNGVASVNGLNGLGANGDVNCLNANGVQDSNACLGGNNLRIGGLNNNAHGAMGVLGAGGAEGIGNMEQFGQFGGQSETGGLGLGGLGGGIVGGNGGGSVGGLGGSVVAGLGNGELGNLGGNGLENLGNGNVHGRLGNANRIGSGHNNLQGIGTAYIQQGMPGVGTAEAFGQQGNDVENNAGGMPDDSGANFNSQFQQLEPQTHSNFAYKSKIKKKKSAKEHKKTAVKGTTRQDIAMPDEQALMDVTKQRQLIGSLGASTLFGDNVGGMGLGHPGVPGMSSGISGMPGEYGGNGGFAHGWEGEGPGQNPHGFNNYGYNYGNEGDGHQRSDTERQSKPERMEDDMSQKREVITNTNDDNEDEVEAASRQVISSLPNTDATVPITVPAQGYEQIGGEQHYLPLAKLPHSALLSRYSSSYHHHSLLPSRNDEEENDEDGGGIYNGNVNSFYHTPDKSEQPRHVHVGVGTPNVKVEVETSKSEIARSPAVHVSSQKMSEIRKLVHEVSDSLAKTNEKLKALKKHHTPSKPKNLGDKRQITPAFTPVTSEPVGVPDIRYPVPAADRYPLGAGYIWPSANQGLQYGGPYAWSKSKTPKNPKGKNFKPKKNNKKSKKEKKVKAAKSRRSVVEKHGKDKTGTKRQYLDRPQGMPYGSRHSVPYHGGMPIYGGPEMGFPVSRSRFAHNSGGYGGFLGGNGVGGAGGYGVAHHQSYGGGAHSFLEGNHMQGGGFGNPYGAHLGGGGGFPPVGRQQHSVHVMSNHGDASGLGALMGGFSGHGGLGGFGGAESGAQFNGGYHSMHGMNAGGFGGNDAAAIYGGGHGGNNFGMGGGAGIGALGGLSSALGGLGQGHATNEAAPHQHGASFGEFQNFQGFGPFGTPGGASHHNSLYGSQMGGPSGLGEAGGMGAAGGFGGAAGGFSGGPGIAATDAGLGPGMREALGGGNHLAGGLNSLMGAPPGANIAGLGGLGGMGGAMGAGMENGIGAGIGGGGGPMGGASGQMGGLSASDLASLPPGITGNSVSGMGGAMNSLGGGPGGLGGRMEGGGGFDSGALPGYGRQNIEQQQPDQESANQQSQYMPMSRSQMPEQLQSMVPESQQAMFVPQGMMTYGSQSNRANEYPASKKSEVPNLKDDKKH